MASHIYLNKLSHYLKAFKPKVLPDSLKNIYRRNYTSSSIIEKEIEVPTFCDIDINVPYSVKIKPLNVHKYHNLDKLLIRIDKQFENHVDYVVDGTSVKIFGKDETVPSSFLCNIRAPVKANLNINSKRDITVGFFTGDKVTLKSTNGSIFVDRFQGTSIEAVTQTGDITLNNFIQASEISANVLSNGSINTGRLQGLCVKLNTKNGDISVESSYCTESSFLIKNGNMNLHNIHKNCQFFLQNGHLFLTGFDGQMSTQIEKGSADMHLSRISGNSQISIKKSGNLNLKITEACQDCCKFEIKTENECIINDNIKSAIEHTGTNTILTPDMEEEFVVCVNVPNGNVNIESTSWQDMMKLRLKK